MPAAVDAENMQQLARLPGQTITLTAEDEFERVPQEYAQAKLAEVMEKRVGKVLQLKVGAQVILTRNLSDTLANGSRGVIVSLKAATAVAGAASSESQHGAGAHPYVCMRATQQRDTAMLAPRNHSPTLDLSLRPQQQQQRLRRQQSPRWWCGSTAA